MPWERPTINQITKRIEKGIESRLFGNIALLRRAILRVLARVFAGSIHTNYGHVEYVKDSFLFVTTANDDALRTRHAPMWGVNPKPGSFATGKVKFTGIDGIIIEEDTRLQNEDGVEFGTLTTDTITSGSVEIDVQAIEAGTESNISIPVPDKIYLQLISPISGVDNQVEIIESITGGEDPEDTESLRSRILQRIQFPPMGGASHDYVRWALEVQGVERAWVYPLSYGPGTVSTVITAEGVDPVPSSALINDVQAYINDLKPVTADHTVESVTDIAGNAGTAKVSLGIAVKPNEPSYREQIRTNLEVLFEPLKPGTEILISQVRGAIAASGVEDYRIDSMIIDSVSYPIADVDLPGFAYPTVDTLSFINI